MRLRRKTYEILKYILDNNIDITQDSELQKIAQKFHYNISNSKDLRKNILRIIRRNNTLIKFEDNYLVPTKEGRDIFYKNVIYSTSGRKTNIEIHYLSFKTEILSITDLDVLEALSHEYNYATSRYGFGSELNIHDEPLGLTLTFTTKNNLFIYFKDNFTGNHIYEIMSEVEEIILRLLPKIESKYNLRLHKSLKHDYEIKLHTRHIAMIDHPLGIWCKKNRAKILVLDEKDRKRLTYDESNRILHVESEVPYESAKIIPEINEMCENAMDGYSMKNNGKDIQELRAKFSEQDMTNMSIKQYIDRQNNISLETSDFMRNINNLIKENLKMQTLLIKETMALKWLKKNIKKPEDVTKYPELVQELSETEKKELEEFMMDL